METSMEYAMRTHYRCPVYGMRLIKSRSVNGAGCQILTTKWSQWADTFSLWTWSWSCWWTRGRTKQCSAQIEGCAGCYHDNLICSVTEISLQVSPTTRQIPLMSVPSFTVEKKIISQIQGKPETQSPSFYSPNQNLWRDSLRVMKILELNFNRIKFKTTVTHPCSLMTMRNCLLSFWSIPSSSPLPCSSPWAQNFCEVQLIRNPFLMRRFSY